MNKMTTTIRILFSLCLFITTALSTVAEEYKSMIRYDRVWECLDLDDYTGDLFIKCMKFDGTEEINGKTYHRLVTFKKSIKTEEGYGIQDDAYKLEGYMREENSRVYALWGSFWGSDISSRDVSDLNPQNSMEILIYDFNRKSGEEYEAWTFITDEPYKGPFRVISEDFIEIDGEMCRRLEIAGIDTYYEGLKDSHTIIEGVGAGEHGCLSYHEYDDKPTKMWCRNVINRVFDIDGNVIFKNIDGSRFDDLNYGSFSEELGIETVKSADCIDNIIYDMMGRRIAQPAPGQLYIQGGRKHIAK